MRTFPICEECLVEYETVEDRRYHAQPIACPACGPRLTVANREGSIVSTSDPICYIQDRLKEGCIVAVKGIGGYSLVVDPVNDVAVRALRERKLRDDKPFALMCSSLTSIRAIANIDPVEERLLTSVERPIVLVRKRGTDHYSQAVSPLSAHHGVMLPYAPVHYLLLAAGFDALVFTSGNISDEPIEYRDENVATRLGGVADYILYNDREISIRIDDSVIRAAAHGNGAAETILIRRARGYVPRPIRFDAPLPVIVGLGAELKNTICVSRGNDLYVSQHIGDLKNRETFGSFLHTIDHFTKLLDVTPLALACDLHPGFWSSRYAAKQQEVKVVRVQHHHAHMASCMCENNISGRAIGVVFDGFGYGLDGHGWGGEFLVGDYASFQRAGHFGYFSLPGGDKAVKDIYRIAVGLLASSCGCATVEQHAALFRNCGEFELGVLLKVVKGGINCYRTSSVGRLFDAAAVLITGRQSVRHEGQAAVELENLILDETYDSDAAFEVEITQDVSGTWVVNVSALYHALFHAAVIDRQPPRQLSLRLHSTFVLIICEMCARLSASTGVSTVVLSGGVFLNRFLLVNAKEQLQKLGFVVHCHRKVPANDGGISLGQVSIAAHQLETARSL